MAKVKALGPVGTSLAGLLLAAAAIAGVGGSRASGQFLAIADPGEPKPPRHIRTLAPPHPYPLPPIVWKAEGSQINPGGYVPAAVFDGTYRPSSPSAYRDAWVIRTSDCSQLLGNEVWDCLEALNFDPTGNLRRVPHGQFWAEAAGRPVVILVHGNLAAGDVAVGTRLYVREHLDRFGALPPDALVVMFDWPSYRVRNFDGLDIAEKQRRGFVAGYHLARLVQGLPPGGRVSLIGHSEGGRAVLSALHLLGGGRLSTLSPGFSVELPRDRPLNHLRLRAAVMGEAVDDDWIVPGERLGQALVPVEGLLDLVNPRDEALDLYPFTLQSGHRPAMGREGLSDRGRERMPPPLLARYAESCVTPYIGPVHTLDGALAQEPVARALAPYTFAVDGPIPGPR